MASLNGQSKLLRVFVGELDKWQHRPFYEAVLRRAKDQGMAGGTVIKGVLSYGSSSILHTSKLLDLSEDLPMVIELIDTEDKIRAFAGVVSEMFEEAGCGGIITLEASEVVYHKPLRGRREQL